MIIPLTKNLQKFANNDSFHGLLKYQDTVNGIYSSVTDGSKYHNQNWWKDHDESFHVKPVLLGDYLPFKETICLRIVCVV